MQRSATAHADDDGVAVVYLAADRAADLDALAELRVVDAVVQRDGVQADAGKRLVHCHLNCRGGRAGAACRILSMDRGGHTAVINGAGCNRYAVTAVAGNRYVLCQHHTIGSDADRLARHRRVHLAAQRGLRRLGNKAVDRARGDHSSAGCDRRNNLIHNQADAGALRRDAACGVLMCHAGRDRVAIAAEVAGGDRQAKAQALATAQVYDLCAELCSIAQAQCHGIAKSSGTADRATDGGGPYSIDGGGESHRIDGNMRRSRVRAHRDGRTAGAVAAAIGIGSADRCADGLTCQQGARNRNAEAAAAYRCCVIVLIGATAHADDDGVAVMHLARDLAADRDALERLHIVDDVVQRYGVKGNSGLGIEVKQHGLAGAGSHAGLAIRRDYRHRHLHLAACLQVCRVDVLAIAQRAIGIGRNGGGVDMAIADERHGVAQLDISAHASGDGGQRLVFGRRVVDHSIARNRVDGDRGIGNDCCGNLAHELRDRVHAQTAEIKSSAIAGHAFGQSPELYKAATAIGTCASCSGATTQSGSGGFEGGAEVGAAVQGLDHGLGSVWRKHRRISRLGRVLGLKHMVVNLDALVPIDLHQLAVIHQEFRTTITHRANGFAALQNIAHFDSPLNALCVDCKNTSRTGDADNGGHGNSLSIVERP